MRHSASMSYTLLTLYVSTISKLAQVSPVSNDRQSKWSTKVAFVMTQSTCKLAMSLRYGCLVSWICYQLIAKSGNKIHSYIERCVSYSQVKIEGLLDLIARKRFDPPPPIPPPPPNPHPQPPTPNPHPQPPTPNPHPHPTPPPTPTPHPTPNPHPHPTPPHPSPLTRLKYYTCYLVNSCINKMLRFL